MLVLGFDFGMKYIGVATGQDITNTATPLTCLHAIDGLPNWDEIAELIKQWQPDALIVGSPLNMDGSMQLLTHCANRFAGRLKHKSRLPVHLVDERLSSWEAKQNASSKDFDKINSAAAAILVQQWLNQLNH